MAFGAALPAHTTRAGFAAAVARDGARRLVVFGYGHDSADPFPQHGCYTTVRSMRAEPVTDLVGQREVIELAVHPGSRRGGIGRRRRPRWPRRRGGN